MTTADVLLVALGVVTVGAGVRVVVTRHLVRAGLHLVLSLGGVAGIYLLLGAELVAWVQVLIYLGAVVVLLLFAVMLTRAPIGPSDDLDRPGWPAALVGGGAALGLAALLVDAYRWLKVDPPPAGTAERLGEEIFGSWVLPFEVLSVLLLAALVGAIVLSRPDIGTTAAGPAAPTDAPVGVPTGTQPDVPPGTRPTDATAGTPGDVPPGTRPTDATAGTPTGVPAAPATGESTGTPSGAAPGGAVEAERR